MSRTLSGNSGSVESLKVSARCCCKPKAPDAADARSRDAAVPRHAARAPMRRSGRLALQRPHDNALNLGIVDRARNARPRLIQQPVNTALDKATGATCQPFALSRARVPPLL